MSDLLSQEEINSLMEKNDGINNAQKLNDTEKDILGEVGNIAMSTSATTLSTLLNRKVTITTPVVQITTFRELSKTFEIPYVLLQIKFIKGLVGTNALLIKTKDASIISNLMMGGDGTNPNETMSEIELSAVSEAMNQMIGSASTSLSTMIKKTVDIHPPLTQIWDNENSEELNLEGMSVDMEIAHIIFNMKIEDLVDSEIMQIYTLEAAKEITEIMMGGINGEEETQNDKTAEEPVNEKPQEPKHQEKAEVKQSVNVQKPEFTPLEETTKYVHPQNIDLIMDVPMELSVVLGETKRTIKDVLSFEPGSIVELNKYAEEPLEIYVNGKLVGQGEVVVVDEKFGIRITNIMSAKERVNSLK